MLASDEKSENLYFLSKHRKFSIQTQPLRCLKIFSLKSFLGANMDYVSRGLFDDDYNLPATKLN